MDSVLKRSQAVYNSICIVVKEKLSLIQELDKTCTQLTVELQQMRQKFLQQFELQNYTQMTEAQKRQFSCQRQKQLQKIDQMEQLLQIKIKNKVRMADQLQQLTKQTYKKVQAQIIQSTQGFLGRPNLKQSIKQHQKIHYGLARHKGRQKNVPLQIRAIASEYMSQKQSIQTSIQQNSIMYCTCDSLTNLRHPEEFIQCQNDDCLVGWYHFECVGIDRNKLPEFWYCSRCKIDKNDKMKVTFIYQNQKVEVQFEDKISKMDLQKSLRLEQK